MIKKNILELIGESTNKYHSAILTSYSFDTLYFNNLFLPSLKRRGISNIIVLLDSSTYDSLMSDYEKYADFILQNDFTLVRQEPLSNGVFHPKIAIFFGSKEGSLFVGSGNLTYSGQSLNEEIWGAIHLDADSAVNFPIFKTAWNYVLNLIPKDSNLINQQVNWIKNYSPWILELDKVKEDYIISQSAEKIQFLANLPGKSLLQQITNLLSDKKVSSIEIISPFYDHNGWLIKQMQENFKPREFTCCLYKDGTYPDNLSSFKNVQFRIWSKTDKLKERLHAKIFQFHTLTDTYLFVGSANATRNAWGESDKIFNDESLLAVIHTGSKYDYIRNLGINLESCPKTECLEQSKPTLNRPNNYAVKLINVEIVNNRLFISWSPKETGKFIALLDNKAETINKFSLDDDVYVDDNCRERVCMAVITDGNIEVSNRCLVIDEEVIIRSDPNPQGKRLSSLLYSSTKWDDNIANILQFVTFESPKAPSGVSKLRVKQQRSESVKHLDASECTDVILKGKAAILAMDNIRIADFLCSALLSDNNSNMQSEESDQQLLAEEVETGETADGENISITKSKTNVQDKERCSIRRYLDKYQNQKGCELESLEEKLIKYQDSKAIDYFPEILEKPTWKRNEGTLTDYSAALVASALICNELVNGNISHIVAKDYLMIDIGRFLLLHGGYYADTKDYAYTKKLRMHKDLAVLTLLAFAQMKWFEKDQEIQMGKVLLLNLMASFKDLADFDDAFVIFKDKISEGKYVFYPESLLVIQQAYKQYTEFKSSGKEKFIRTIDPLWSYAIAWKHSVGFVFIYNFQKNKEVNPSRAKEWIWSYSLLVSGYIYDDEYLPIRKGQKLVLLESFV